MHAHFAPSLDFLNRTKLKLSQNYSNIEQFSILLEQKISRVTFGFFILPTKWRFFSLLINNE